MAIRVPSVPVCFSGRVFCGFWWRSVVGSAVASRCVSWSVGRSSLAFSGACVRVAFGSLAAASAFARLWAGRCGVFCAVRRVNSAFVVSVPVVWLWG